MDGAFTRNGSRNGRVNFFAITSSHINASMTSCFLIDIYMSTTVVLYDTELNTNNKRSHISHFRLVSRGLTFLDSPHQNACFKAVYNEM